MSVSTRPRKTKQGSPEVTTSLVQAEGAPTTLGEAGPPGLQSPDEVGPGAVSTLLETDLSMTSVPFPGLTGHPRTYPTRRRGSLSRGPLTPHTDHVTFSLQNPTPEPKRKLYDTLEPVK